MRMEEIQRLAKVKVIAAQRPWGSHFLNRGHTDLWLDIDNSKLKGIRLVRTSGWKFMETQSSPRINLCTGELTFFVRLRLPKNLQGWQVLVDGNALSARARNMMVLELPPGTHEISVTKEGGASLSKEIMIQSDSPGEFQIDFTDKNE